MNTRRVILTGVVLLWAGLCGASLIGPTDSGLEQWNAEGDDLLEWREQGYVYEEGYDTHGGDHAAMLFKNIYTDPSLKQDSGIGVEFDASLFAEGDQIIVTAWAKEIEDGADFRLTLSQWGAPNASGFASTVVHDARDWTQVTLAHTLTAADISALGTKLGITGGIVGYSPTDVYGVWLVDDVTIEVLSQQDGVIPEPGTISLLGIGLAGLLLRFRPKR